MRSVNLLQRAFSELTVERIRRIEKRGRPRTAAGVWLTSLYTAYIAVVKSLIGEPLLYVDVEENPPVEGDPELAEAFYCEFIQNRELRYRYCYPRRYDERIEKIKDMVEAAKEERNYDLMVGAAAKANELLGTRDGFVEIPSYRPVITEAALPREEAEKVVELGERVADIFAKLGGRAEAELRKLVFSGYKEGILDTIEGLTDEEKRFLEDVIGDPIRRAALLFAYKRVGNYKRLLPKILYNMYFRNIPYILYLSKDITG